jgi:alpha-amylase
MLNVALCFHVHQPYRLKNLRFFENAAWKSPFDDELNRHIIERVSQTCYLPAGDLLLSLAGRWGRDFRIAFSITGTAIEQLRSWGGDALQTFRSLSSSGSAEFLGETYYHSLFSLYDREEFLEQVDMHTKSVVETFGAEPGVFRNTELLYDDRVSDYLSALDRFGLILCEDAVRLDSRSGAGNLFLSYNGLHRLLLRDQRLSDDVGFRFVDRWWSEYPLTAEKFAVWLEELGDEKMSSVDREDDPDRDRFLLLYLDYETLGEHHDRSSGIFQFIEQLAEVILNHARLKLCWPSEALHGQMPPSRLSVESPVSWADSEKGTGAWLSSDLQRNAMSTLLRAFECIRQNGDEELLQRVRKLSSSDHFYFMYPWDGSADGDVHRRFTPYSSPEDAYLRMLNVITALEHRII